MRVFVKIFLSLLLLSFSTCWYFWHDYKSASVVTAETTIIIPRASGFSKSADILAENNVVGHPMIYKLVGWLTGDARKIKAGEYKFPAGITSSEIMKMMVAGQVVVHKFTVPEGLSVREIRQRLLDEKILDGEVPNDIAEGSLHPETYHIFYGDTRASIIEKMQEAQKKILAELWEKRAEGLPFATPEQALILASIVEKETGVDTERARVAGVFINRLRKGMKLQSDPTTVYGIEQQTGKPLGRAITLEDLRTETKFNTYTIPALPPTPICNMGRASIEAVLHPMQTDELYFVATGTGGHNFATTMDEHSKNISEYRKVKSENGKKSGN